MILKKIDKLPLSIFMILCLTMGLAPFSPPHIYEKIMMLVNSQPLEAVDWFDVFIHGSPWVLLSLKFFTTYKLKLNRN